jgi:hypothetical protein
MKHKRKKQNQTASRKLHLFPPCSFGSRLERVSPQLSPSNYYFILSGSTIKKPFKQSRMLKRFCCAAVKKTVAMYVSKVVKSTFVVQIKKRVHMSRHFVTANRVRVQGTRWCNRTAAFTHFQSLRTVECPRQRYLAVSLG